MVKSGDDCCDIQHRLHEISRAAAAAAAGVYIISYTGDASEVQRIYGVTRLDTRSA